MNGQLSRGETAVLLLRAVLVTQLLMMVVGYDLIGGASYHVVFGKAFVGSEADVLHRQPVTDYDVYLSAVLQASAGQIPYLTGWTETLNFHYSPVFLVLFLPWTLMDWPLGRGLWLVLLGVGYLFGLWTWWGVLRDHAGLSRSAMASAMLVPVCIDVWVIIQYFGNVSLLMMAASGLAAKAVLDRKAGRAAFWIVLVLFVKPTWAFPLVLVPFLRDWPFVRRLCGATVLFLGAGFAASLLFLGGSGLVMWGAYLRFMESAQSTLPLHGTEAMFLMVQNSVPQTLARYAGIQPWIWPLSALLRALFVVAAFGAAWRVWRAGKPQPGREGSLLVLMFIVFLAGTLLLSQFEELLPGGVIFVLLWATRRPVYRLAALPFAFWGFHAIQDVLVMVTGEARFRLDSSVPILLIAGLSMLAALCHLSRTGQSLLGSESGTV